MLKTKYVLSALSLLAAMTIATSAFAQATFTVASSIEPRARMNGQTELAGSIGLTLASGTIAAAANNGSVMIDYGTTITNSGSETVSVCGTAATALRTGQVTVSGSTITIQVTDADTCTAVGNRIDVSGVRVAIAGQGLSDVQANITSSGGVQLAAGANEVTVINSIVDELVDSGVTAGEKITLIRHTAAPSDEAYFKLLIEENAVDSFGDMAELNLDFSGIGSGMSVTIDAWVAAKEDLDDLEPTSLILNDCGAATDDATTMVDETRDCVATNGQLALVGGAMEDDVLEQTLTSQSTEAVVKMGFGTALNGFDSDDATEGVQIDGLDENGDAIVLTDITTGSLDPNKVDVVVIRGSIRVTTRGPGAVSLPLGDVNIAATVDVGPIGPATYARTFRGTRLARRFASDPSHAVKVIDVTSDQTMLRIPFAAVIGDSWDTGIAIANTNTASDQMGAITFNFFAGDAEMDPYTTMGGSPGSGLNDDGMLEAGGTYAVQLSDVLEAAGHDAAYSGYVEITTDFTDAKGFVFLSSFAGGAWGAAGAIDDITDE